ncbi:MAG: PKD domain-containing protein [Bacteroidota bacterium]
MNPRIGGSIGYRPDLESPCGQVYASTESLASGAWDVLNGQPFRIYKWYATFTVPDGTPIALFEWEPGDGLGIDFDASFESDQSREIDVTAPAKKVPVSSYAWDFGDGESGTGAKPSHEYADPGEYEVTLTVTDDDGETASRTETVTVDGVVLEVEVEMATEEVIAPGDTILVQGRVTNASTETVFGVRVQRDFFYTYRIAEDSLNQPGSRIRSPTLTVLPVPDGEDLVETRSSLAPGESILITRRYAVEEAGTYRAPQAASYTPEDFILDWMGVVGVEGETPEIDSVPVRQTCEGADPACAETLVQPRRAALELLTFTIPEAVPVETATVTSGLLVGPDARFPVFLGSPTRRVAHFQSVDDEKRCRAGCIDFEVTATDPDTGAPLAGLKLDLSHPVIDGATVVTPGQGGGFFCDRVEETCGREITLTTDDEGRIEGYLAVPGVIGETNVVATVVVNPSQSGAYQGMAGTAEQAIVIEPNILYNTPIPINQQQAEDLGSATAIQVGFQRAELPSKLCAGVKSAFDSAKKRSFVFKEKIPTEFIDEVCKNVNELPLLELLPLAKGATQMPQMAWFFESTQLPDVGLATSSFQSTPPFFGVSSQTIDELSTALQGQLDSNGDLQPGAAPFSLFEVSYLARQSGQSFPVKTRALYFRMWSHTALIDKDYEPLLWLFELHDRSAAPSFVDIVSSGSTAIATAGGSSTVTAEEARPHLLVASGGEPGNGARPSMLRTRVARPDSLIAMPDSLTANALIVLSPDDPEIAEVVRVLSVIGDLTSGQTAELASPLAYDHPAGAELRVIGEGESVPPALYTVAPVDTVSFGTAVRLSWAAFQPVTEVDVEVARDPGFTDIVASETLSGAEIQDGSFDIDLATAGIAREAEYFWRARGRDRSGESVWSDTTRFYISSVVTSSEDVPSEELASALMLSVYPNPASAITRLAVEAPRSGHQRVVLYDALGRQVAVLIDEERSAGLHELAIQTSGLPAGAYVVRLDASGEVITQRLTVVR